MSSTQLENMQEKQVVKRFQRQPSCKEVFGNEDQSTAGKMNPHRRIQNDEKKED